MVNDAKIVIRSLLDAIRDEEQKRPMSKRIMSLDSAVRMGERYLLAPQASEPSDDKVVMITRLPDLNGERQYTDGDGNIYVVEGEPCDKAPCMSCQRGRDCEPCGPPAWEGYAPNWSLALEAFARIEALLASRKPESLHEQIDQKNTVAMARVIAARQPESAEYSEGNIRRRYGSLKKAYSILIDTLESTKADSEETFLRVCSDNAALQARADKAESDLVEARELEKHWHVAADFARGALSKMTDEAAIAYSARNLAESEARALEGLLDSASKRAVDVLEAQRIARKALSAPEGKV
jgi:hypothetical protein